MRKEETIKCLKARIKELEEENEKLNDELNNKCAWDILNRKNQADAEEAIKKLREEIVDLRKEYNTMLEKYCGLLKEETYRAQIELEELLNRIKKEKEE